MQRTSVPSAPSRQGDPRTGTLLGFVRVLSKEEKEAADRTSIAAFLARKERQEQEKAVKQRQTEVLQVAQQIASPAGPQTEKEWARVAEDQGSRCGACSIVAGVWSHPRASGEAIGVARAEERRAKRRRGSAHA